MSLLKSILSSIFGVRNIIAKVLLIILFVVIFLCMLLFLPFLLIYKGIQLAIFKVSSGEYDDYY